MARLKRDRLLQFLLLLVAVLAIINPRSGAEYLQWLDLPTLAGLSGLLILTQGVRESGYVQHWALLLVKRLHTVRALAIALALLSAVLAAVLTNDVSLFLVVPLTLTLDRVVRIPRHKLVVFEALAVNAGATFSPIGNPQNLLLWRHSGLSFPAYVAALAPTGAMLLVVLLILCRFAFAATPLHVDDDALEQPALDRPLLLGALLLLVAMVAAMQWGFAVVAALALLMFGLAFFRRVLAAVDWLLLATFAAMFVGLGHLAALPAVHAQVATLDWQNPRMVYGGAIALSQLISNVPAVVLLQHYTSNLTLLAAAANVGGAGLAIGSLASLIALRLDGSRGIGWRFHLWSLPYLVVTALLVAVLLLR